MESEGTLLFAKSFLCLGFAGWRVGNFAESDVFHDIWIGSCLELLGENKTRRIRYTDCALLVYTLASQASHPPEQYTCRLHSARFIPTRLILCINLYS